MATTAVELPTGSLFEITDHLQALFDTVEMVEQPELKREAEAEIARFLEAEVRKVDGINGYFTQCESQQAAAKSEIERLRARASMWENREERVRSYVQRVMEQGGYKKLEGRTATFLLRAVPASVVIIDEALVPEEFKRTTVTVSIDKAAIKKAINAGHDVLGADLSIGKSTLVRK
jgi:Siphovirus Gp157